MATKTIDNIENPIDNIFYELANYINPYLYKLNFTPNMITICGLFFGLISHYFLYNYNIIIAFIFIILSQFCDCIDGQYARKYNMTSKFGDILDHGTDIIKIIIFSIILYNKYNLTTLLIILFIILAIINLLFNVCLFKYENKNSESIQVINYKQYCIIPQNYLLKFLNTIKYLCNSSTIIFIYILLIIRNYLYKNK
tara:strand:+ start:1495 stop:2085 length:591 start_codon:yes stop_codon:yes gene_type:complete